MPLPITSDVRNALKARNLASVWIMDMFVDGTALRGSTAHKTITYDSNDYEPLGDQFKLEGEIKTGIDLIAEPLIIRLSADAILDDVSFVGRFVDSEWWQRRIRVRQILFVPGGALATVIGLGFDWLGYMDFFEEGPEEGQSHDLILNCESGIFRARGRNMHTYTDKDQRLFDAADPSFKNTAIKPFQSIPFGESWVNVPGGNPSATTSLSQPNKLFGRYGG